MTFALHKVWKPIFLNILDISGKLLPDVSGKVKEDPFLSWFDKVMEEFLSLEQTEIVEIRFRKMKEALESVLASDGPYKLRFMYLIYLLRTKEGFTMRPWEKKWLADYYKSQMKGV